MKKSDLKTGMLVESEEDVYLVVGNTLMGSNGGWDDLDEFNEDLTSSSEPELTINRVSEVLSDSDLRICNLNSDTITMNLLWERNPVQTIEIAGQKFDKKEVENALKNLKPIK